MTESRTCRRCGAAVAPGAAVRGMCPRCLLELGLGDDSVVFTGHGEPPPPPDPEDLAPLFPRFEILELLGRGGMGVVYRARQKDLDREVALKILPHAAGRDPSFPERFAREARTLAALDHLGVVRVHDFGRTGEHYWLVMELVDGVTLRELIRRREVAPRQALEIVMQVCDALQYAHDEGVVHRDVKPENVLVDRKGRVKIADFGLAKLLRAPGAGGEALTHTGRVMGTPHYMAPEQIEHPLEVDHRADVYALGVVLYELLTGELPLGRFAPPSERVRVDVRLDEVVMKALEREPERRYQRAGDVRTDVERITTSEPAAPAGAKGDRGRGSRAERPSGGGGRRKVLWIGGCAALLLLVPCLLGAAALFLAPARVVGELEYETSGDPPAPLPGDLLTWTDGVPRVRPGGVVPPGPTTELVDEVLADVHGPYVELEASRTEIRHAEGGVTVHVAPFPAERAGLELLLASRLADAAPYAPHLPQAVAPVLLPFGETAVDLRLAYDADGYTVVETSAADSSAERYATFDELPPHVQRLWRRAFVPLPGSAVPALRRVLAALDELSAAAPEGVRLVHREIVATSTGEAGRRAFDDAPPVRIRLEPRVEAPDPAAASEHLGELLERLRAVEGVVDVERGASMPSDEGRVLRLEKLVVSVRLRPFQGAVTGQRTDLEPRIRSLAAEHGLPPLEIAVSRRRVGPDEDVVYALRPTEEHGPQAPGPLLDFAEALEGLAPAALVDEVLLAPGNFVIELLVRGRAD